MTTLPVLNCDGCGVCCEAQGSPPGYEMAENRAHLPNDLRFELDEYYESARISGPWRRGLPCLWYDPIEQRCQHYEWRPSICREFEINSKACSEWRQIFGMSASSAEEESGLSAAALQDQSASA